MLLLQAREPALLLTPVQLGLGLLGQSQVVLGMRLPDHFVLPRTGEDFQPELAQRLQHPPTWSPIVLPLLSQQALIHQQLQSLQDIPCQAAPCVTYLPGRLPGPPIDKDREPSEELLLLRRE